MTDLTTLVQQISGTVLQPGDSTYDEVRTIWNAMIDRRPLAIVRCANTKDVVAALGFARANNLDISVHCGGHSITGHSVVEGGIMIDLSPMSTVTVDPEAKIARVSGGALLGSLDRAAQAYGLATTAGNVSHTGVGGLTLAGGMGWLARQFGLACDNLVSCEVVLADGSVVRASKTEHPDLFWGLRGGGGNFGIVTEFVFQLREIDNRALFVECFFDMTKAHTAFRTWRDMLPDAPRNVTLTAWMGISGTQDFLPEAFHNKPLTNIGFVWIGDPAEGRQYLESFLKDLQPIGQNIKELSYLELQTIDDDPQHHGVRRYWKGHYLNEITDEAIDAFLARTEINEVGAGGSISTSIQAYGGAIAETSAEESSYSHRQAVAEVVNHVRWMNPDEDDRYIALGRSYARSLEPFASGTYIHASQDETQSTSSYADTIHSRLVQLKQQYDPENVFHHNVNIDPRT